MILKLLLIIFFEMVIFQNCDDDNSFASFIPENLGSKYISPSPDENLIIHNEEKTILFHLLKEKELSKP